MITPKQITDIKLCWCEGDAISWLSRYGDKIPVDITEDRLFDLLDRFDHRSPDIGFSWESGPFYVIAGTRLRGDDANTAEEYDDIEDAMEYYVEFRANSAYDYVTMTDAEGFEYIDVSEA